MPPETLDWAQFTSELADEANDLAENLVGVDRDEVGRILDTLRAQTALAIRQHGYGRKRADVMAEDFAQLVRRHWVQLQSTGFQSPRGMQ
jgi:hypothetical protein